MISRKSWYFLITTVLTLCLLATSVASAAVDKVITVPWQGDPAKQHTIIGAVAEPVPDSITFEILNTHCSWDGTWEFFLNSTSLGTVPADPSAGCTCTPPLQSVLISKAAIIASGGWQTGGNALRANLTGSPYYSWVRAQIVTGGNTNTFCLGDYNGGTCTEMNLCSAGYVNGPVNMTMSISPEYVLSQLKGVIKTTSTDPIWYKWVFGDGNESAVVSLNGAQKYSVDTTHAYIAATGTPITAKLQVSNTDPFAVSRENSYLMKVEDNSLDARINMSIDKGLWYLYKHATNTDNTYDGSPFMSWQDSNYSVWASSTASAIQAFAINNHKFKGDPDLDPYAEAVQLGMNYLMKGNNALQAVTGLADGNNGVGIQTVYANHQIYEGGQVMDAIISSGVLTTDLTGRSFAGGTGHIWTYKEVLQDLADMYIYYQGWGNGTLGAWGEWNFGSYEHDNSSSQWAAIGLLPSQASPWNINIPQSVKDNNKNWINYSYYDYNNGTASFGYQYPGQCNDSCFNTTPCGMVQMNFDGFPKTDTKWVAASKYMADNWWGLLQDVSGWGNQKTYGMYSFVKAMRLANPDPVVQITKTNGHAFDWYRGGSDLANDANFDKGLAVRILEMQNADGHWAGNLSGLHLTTAWMIIALKPTLFASAPIACFTAAPNPSYPDQPITFDPSCSGHSETGKSIANLTKFEWDWNNDGIFETVSALATIQTHSFACATLPCTYPVTLRVTDDNNPALTATTVVNINITNPPHPPVANAGGPYTTSLCSKDTLVLDGSKSFDQDQGQHEAGCTTCPNDTITAWDWDLRAPLTDFTDRSGKIVTLTGAQIASFFTPAGSYDIGLRVTDNTALAYPGSGKPNLTNAAFGKVNVMNGCICNLAARAKLNKIQLTWTNINATSYDVYRSTTGPNTGFTKIASNVVTTYSTYLDQGLTVGTKYYYRVVPNGGNCTGGSNAASAVPTAR